MNAPSKLKICKVSENFWQALYQHVMQSLKELSRHRKPGLNGKYIVNSAKLHKVAKSCYENYQCESNVNCLCNISG